MPAAAPPENEPERLKVLRDLQLLDTPPEDGLDKITALLAQMLEAPISLVSLVDESRQWFKSCYGIDARETDRESSFCAHTILAEEALIVEDATNDSRTSDNSLVLGPPYIRAYLGYPVKLNGHNIGSICVIDTEPRTFTQREIDLLRLAASWVEREIQLRDRGRLIETRDKFARRAYELFHHAPYPLISLRSDGTIGEINMIGKGLWEIVGPTLVTQHFSRGMVGGSSIREIVQRLVDEGGASSLDPIRLDSEHGNTFYLQPSAVVDPANPDGIFLALFDQTELVLASQARSAAEVDARKERSANLIEQREFMARLSHEMRNSINGLVGLVELWKQDSPTEEQMQHLESCVISLKELVDDTLDYDQIQSGRLSIEKHVFDLKALCDEVSTSSQAAAALKNLAFVRKTVLGQGYFVGDSLRIRQILNNLLSNSVKYTGDGCISFEASLEENGVRFVVSDTGEGMSAEFQSKVFEPYTQAAGMPRSSSGGVGLGLAIVGELVQHMEGSIGLQSSLGEGSTFEVFLPLPTAPPEEKKQQIEELPKLGLQVLVVDDNAINRTVMSAQLLNLGCEVDSAADGELALEYLEENHPDLILLDCHMPKLDGFETARRINVQPEKYGNPIIVALTASVEPHAEERCREAGMHHFLQKPLRFLDLYHKLKDLVPTSLTK